MDTRVSIQIKCKELFKYKYVSHTGTCWLAALRDTLEGKGAFSDECGSIEPPTVAQGGCAGELYAQSQKYLFSEQLYLP